MRKTSAAGTFVLMSIAGASMVLAQPRGGGGGGGGGMFVTPLGSSLDKVPVGTWAEYEMKRGDGPGRKIRQALVGKAGADFVVETRVETARGDHMITQATLGKDPSAESGVKKLVSQFGDGDPMEMPTGRGPGGGGPGGGGPGAKAGNDPVGGDKADGPGRSGRMMGRGGGYLKPDPKSLIGKESITLAGAAYQTEHYRQAGPRGGTVDFWISKKAGPFGLVKLEMERPAGPDGDGGGKTTVQLVKTGAGAKPEITKPAKPFDPEAMRGRWGGGDRGGDRGPGRPAGGAPGGGPSSPH